MFRDAIAGVVERTDGGLAGMLMDFEGIPIEVYSKEGAQFDVEVVGAEASVVIKAIMRANEMLEAGVTREISFASDKLVTLIRILNDNYFMTLTLSPGGNRGKGRYLMRTIAPKLIEELG